MPSMLLRAMAARDTEEAHRASTPLELFFDLTFVVAVSLAATRLAQEVEAGHAAHGVALFAMVFFAVWWGWLNFTWFASAYDTDDWLYRVVTLVQMGGALTVAAGVPKVFDDENFTVMVIGYVIMRLAMVFQWLRAARNDEPRRRTALTYAAGISLVQVLWIARLALPHSLWVVSFLVLLLGELAVPVIAERRGMTTYHPAHVAERYGLFTIIVLGEGVLASGNSVIEALQDGKHIGALVALAIGGLTLLAGMWWVYFAVDPAEDLRSFRGALTWGYGHYLLFAAAAAVSSGIEVQVAFISGEHEHVSEFAARSLVGVPVALFVLMTCALVLRSQLDTPQRYGAGLAIAALLVVCVLPLTPSTASVVDAVVLALFVGADLVTGAAG